MKSPKSKEETEKLLPLRKLAKLRSTIEALDHTIIKALNKRMVVAKAVGEIKQQYKLKIKDKKREVELQKLYQQWAQKYHINPILIQKIFMLIIRESRRIQTTKTHLY